MSESKRAEGKYDSKYDDDDYMDTEDKGTYVPDPPKIEITGIDIDPVYSEITAPLKLKIRFELDRDCVAANWVVKLLVDSSFKRIIMVSMNACSSIF